MQLVLYCFFQLDITSWNFMLRTLQLEYSKIRNWNSVSSVDRPLAKHSKEKILFQLGILQLYYYFPGYFTGLLSSCYPAGIAPHLQLWASWKLSLSPAGISSWALLEPDGFVPRSSQRKPERKSDGRSRSKGGGGTAGANIHQKCIVWFHRAQTCTSDRMTKERTYRWPGVFTL